MRCLGSVKVPLARKLQIDEARVGGLVERLRIHADSRWSWRPAFWSMRSAQQAVLAGGFVLLIVSLALLVALRDPIATALVAVLLLGTGWSALVNVLNVTSPPAFLPPDRDHRRTWPTP